MDLPPIVPKKCNKTSHTSHGFSPNYAHERENAFYVRTALDAAATAQRKYPPLDAGDHFRVSTKPRKMTQPQLPTQPQLRELEPQ